MRHHLKLSACLCLAFVSGLPFVTAQAANRAEAEQFVKDGLNKDPRHFFAELYSIRWQLMQKFNMPDQQKILHFRNLESREAADDFTKAIEADPNYDEAYYLRGEAKAIWCSYKNAISDLNMALKLDPKMLKALWARAACNSCLGLHQQSIEDYTACLSASQEVVPGFRPGLCHRNRGMEYAALGRLDEALADYNEAIKLEPRDDKGYYYRYQLYKQMDKGYLASADKAKYLQYRDQSTPDFETLKPRADYREPFMANDKVEEFYEKRIKQYPFDEDDHYCYAHWLLRQGKNDRSLSEIDVALKLDPKFGQALDLREKILRAKGNTEEADVQGNRRKWIGFEDGAREQNRAFVEGIQARNKGELDDALYHFTRTIEIDKSFAEAYVRRAEVFEFLANNCPFVYKSNLDTWKISKSDLISLADSDRQAATKLGTKFAPCSPIHVALRGIPWTAGPRVLFVKPKFWTDHRKEEAGGREARAC